MSGGGGGPGNYPGESLSINVGGVSIQIPYTDPSVPYAFRVRDISLCIAIQQMANTISDENIRAVLYNAAEQALEKEAHLFLTEVEAPKPVPIG